MSPDVIEPEVTVRPEARWNCPTAPEAIEPETTAAFPIWPLFTAPEAMANLEI